MAFKLAQLLVIACAALFLSEHVALAVPKRSASAPRRKRTSSTPTCFAPAVKLPPPKAADVKSAIAAADEYLIGLSHAPDVDSVVAAVVTPDGSIYEGTYGLLRANETDPASQGTVDRDSVYRIASVTKVFTAWEAYILRDRGVLGWDDKVKKYLPTFKLETTIRHVTGQSRASAGTAEASHFSFFFPFPFNVAADGATNGYAALAKRDIFTPLDMTSSSFTTNPALKSKTVVASVASCEADYDFLNAMNGAGGQMSSLADLVKSQQILLDPSRKGSNISPYTVREWMRPLYSFADDFYEVGHVWEIVKRKDSFGRTYRIYEKNGALGGFHTVYALNPDSGYGVIALTSGSHFDAHNIAWDLFDILQTSVDAYRATTLKNTYSGTYLTADKSNKVFISVRNGNLYADQFVLENEDFQGPVALWPVAEDGLTFRLSFGIPGFTPPNYGCILDTIGFDPGYSRGKAIGLVQFAVEGGKKVLYVPSIGAKLSWVS
ncbi:beta-lactamase/transpeptidase-like protein [Exidia glandulosa HHB12029]|uniref:Beta-lactamase/transpeptidase-like protein n=1 Tax=Exidia glandulosa HHB12029 TaxID=1314781 RepID=A0A166AK81_EXIGL|nr:beta-lactamase/transpeptidase-like protein [Exidia glandulosa HHB12029]